MKNSILYIFLPLIWSAGLVHGATVVVTDSNAQTEINSANNGDIIRFMPGTYPKITVVEKDLVFKHHGSVKANVFEIEANGSKLDLIDFSAAEVFANKSQNRTSRLRVVRGRYGRITSDADNTILAYSTLNYLKITDSGKITGNDFDGDTQFFSQVSVGGGIGIDVNASNAQIMIKNNLISNYILNRSHGTTIDNECIGIRINGSPSVDIFNNIIKDCYDNKDGSELTSCMGIYVVSAIDIRILGNVLSNCGVQHGTNNGTPGNRLIFAPLGVVAQNNLFWKTNYHFTTSAGGGVVPVATIIADPKLNSNNTLKADSPCIDAGPPDPQYNDRDGSRNDIGMFGGHNFIPNGRTTNRPIVLGLDIAPIAVPTGGTVTIESTGVTVK